MSTIRHISRSEHNRLRTERRTQAGLPHLARLLKEKAARDADTKLAGTESDEVIDGHSVSTPEVALEVRAAHRQKAKGQT